MNGYRLGVVSLVAIMQLFTVTLSYAEKFLWYPFEEDHRETQWFGWYQDGSARHYGIDYDTSEDLGDLDIVYSTMSGTVDVLQDQNPSGCPQGGVPRTGYGNHVEIVNGNKRLILAHFMYEGFFVQEGDYVLAGQPMGYAGNSGWTSGGNCNGTFFHLHHEIRIDGLPVDPFSHDGGLWIEPRKYALSNVHPLINNAYNRNGGVTAFGPAWESQPNHHGALHWYNNDPSTLLIRYHSGGTFGVSAIILDLIGGAHDARVIRSGFALEWFAQGGNTARIKRYYK